MYKAPCEDQIHYSVVMSIRLASLTITPHRSISFRLLSKTIFSTLTLLNSIFTVLLYCLLTFFISFVIPSLKNFSSFSGTNLSKCTLQSTRVLNSLKLTDFYQDQNKLQSERAIANENVKWMKIYLLSCIILSEYSRNTRSDCHPVRILRSFSELILGRVFSPVLIRNSIYLKQSFGYYELTVKVLFPMLTAFFFMKFDLW